MTLRKRALIAGLASIFALGAGCSLWLWATLPEVNDLAWKDPQETALMRERGGSRLKRWVPLEGISPWLVEAVVVAEDGRFYQHDGFDFYEMRQAFKRNWEEGRTIRGASTISQQLAKNLFLSTDRTYTRKIKEAILTLKLESALSKERILELYLNLIEWGEGVYGAEAAARQLLGKSASELDASEAALLAAMIPSPLRLDPCERPRAVRRHQERILRWMHRAHHLDDNGLEQALEKNVMLRPCWASIGPGGSGEG